MAEGAFFVGLSDLLTGLLFVLLALPLMLGKVARKVARRIATKSGEDPSADGVLTAEEVRELLGRPKVHPEKANIAHEVGIATGMYYTPMGGDIMFVEASVLPITTASPSDGNGGGAPVSLFLTGQLGDVMK